MKPFSFILLALLFGLECLAQEADTFPGYLSNGFATPQEDQHSSSSESQKGSQIEFFIAAGYGLGSGGAYFTSSTKREMNQLVNVEDHYWSIGQGLKIDGGVNYGISPLLGVQLAGGYTRSSTLAVSQSNKNENNTGSIDALDYTASFFHIDAMLLVSGALQNIKVYSGAGAGMFFANQSEVRELTTVQINPFTGDLIEIKSQSERDFKFNPSIGFIGVAGVKFPFQSLSFFMEARLEQVSFLATEYEYTKVVVDGEDRLDEIDVDPNREGNQTSREYKKDSVDDPEPPRLQGSSIGLRAGIIVSL